MFSSNIALVALGPVHDEMVCLVINPNINHNLSAMAVDTKHVLIHAELQEYKSGY